MPSKPWIRCFTVWMLQGFGRWFCCYSQQSFPLQWSSWKRSLSFRHLNLRKSGLGGWARHDDADTESCGQGSWSCLLLARPPSSPWEGQAEQQMSAKSCTHQAEKWPRSPFHPGQGGSSLLRTPTGMEAGWEPKERHWLRPVLSQSSINIEQDSHRHCVCHTHLWLS